jgi:preprotein translocase subunit SecA
LGRFGELLGQLTLVTRGPAALHWQRWRAAVERAGALESPLLALTASELRKQSLDLRWRAKEREPLRHLLPEAFALVREAARRVLGMRHYDVQLLAGCTLHDGCIAEMETGEGKTLMATAPAYLNALTGQGVHVVTVNDYLASRDADLMRPVYECLGLTVGCIHNQQPPEDRRQAYACDITYGTANEFAFDFLRDRLNGQSGTVKEQLGSLLFGSQDTEALSIQRGQHYAIVDEADSVLIDEARTPLIICGAAAEEDPEVVAAYLWAAQAAPQIAEDRDYKYDRDTKQVELTPAGRWRVRNLPSPRELHAVAMDEIFEYVERAVKVLRDYQRDRQYVVRDGEVLIVDEFTGRILPGRKWRDGMHQAIEAREGVPVTAATNQAARTTIQNYFLRYEKLSGMTGTAWSARSELRSIYKLLRNSRGAAAGRETPAWPSSGFPWRTNCSKRSARGLSAGSKPCDPDSVGPLKVGSITCEVCSAVLNPKSNADTTATGHASCSTKSTAMRCRKKWASTPISIPPIEARRRAEPESQAQPSCGPVVSASRNPRTNWS